MFKCKSFIRITIMKSNVFLNKLSLILFLGVLFALSCTKTDREYDSPLSVHVPNSQDNVRMGDEIQIESEVIFIDTIPVISEIVDMVQVENNCYVLDNNKVLSCIDMREGKIISQKRQIGHSSKEFVQPRALSSDSSLIYVYDSGTNRVVWMDLGLCFKGSIDMPCMFERFTKVEGGYLCYSEYRPTVYFITDAGKLVYAHNMADYIVDMSSKSNVFFKDMEGNVYVKAEYSDTIFQWSNGECIPKYIFDFGQNKVPGNIVNSSEMWTKQLSFSMDFFVEQKQLVFSYVEGRIKRYICYSTKSNSLSNFSGDSIKNIPFIPQWKDKFFYYALINPEIARFIIKDINPSQSMLIKYRIAS